MILIADSGSTKTDWAFVNESEVTRFSTQGFNPFFHNSTYIEGKLRSSKEMMALANQLNQVYFYGAGCSSDERKQVVAVALQSICPNAEIIVEEDMVAAALACTRGEKGIVCILGTGSNACYFDGKQAHEAFPALDYILGDEGSGVYFGKKIIAAYLRNQLSDSLTSALDAFFDMPKQEILERVYRKEGAKAFLASVMKVVAKYRDDAYVHHIVYNGLKRFARINIMQYEAYHRTPVHFVGSIGYHFKEALEALAREMGFELGVILQTPIEELIEYHKAEQSSKQLT